jgi:hypothetical protein
MSKKVTGFLNVSSKTAFGNGYLNGFELMSFVTKKTMCKCVTKTFLPVLFKTLKINFSNKLTCFLRVYLF